MSKLRLYGSTSGYKDLVVPAVSDNTELNLGNFVSNNYLDSGVTTLTDEHGDVRQAPVTSVTSTPYTIPSGSSGLLFKLSAGSSNINVNVANFAEGDVVTLVNISDTTRTLTFDAWTNKVRIAGGDGTNLASSTATLAAYGVATLIAIAGARLVINGNVS